MVTLQLFQQLLQPLAQEVDLHQVLLLDQVIVVVQVVELQDQVLEVQEIAHQ